MKEFNIEDLELEKINTIEIEKHFFKINKEDKIENKFIGLRIFTNRIDEKNLNNNNLKYLNTNEKEFKRNFLDTLTFEKVISKKTENYNSKFTYGLYQIDDELNTSFKNEKEETIYNYPELNGDIKTIKYLLKEYYLTEIAPTLFVYEFLK